MRAIENKYGRSILHMSRDDRDRLVALEQELLSSGVDEETFVSNRLRQSRMETLLPLKRVKANDDGVDFVIRFDDQVYVAQLKWWRKPLTTKQLKAIYGEMYFSEHAMRYRVQGVPLRYVLLAPILAKTARWCRETFAAHGFDLLCDQDFIRFLSNPHYCFLTLREGQAHG